MSKFCPQCGNAMDDTQTICAQCGKNLGPVQQAEAQPVQQPVYQQPIQQPVYQQPVQQPVYQQPVQQPIYQTIYQQPQPVGNGAGTAGMVLGIIAFVFAMIGVFAVLASPLAIVLSLVFWIIAGILMLPGFGLSLGGSFGNKPKGKAIAGLIMNGLVLGLWIYIIAAADALFRYL